MKLAHRTVLAGSAAALALLPLGSRTQAAIADCPDSNPPNELVVAGGSPQTTQLGTQFQTNLQVQLANTNGCPLTGQLGGNSVEFVATSSGASGTFASSGSNVAVVGTDAQGLATAPAFTANFTVGSYRVAAQSGYGAANLSLTNTASGLPASIAATGATSQEAAVNGQYAQPLQARVTDANGKPVQSATVTFSIVTGPTGAGAGFLGGNQATASTDSNGLATSPPLLANGTPGRFTATAATERLAAVATYTLDNHAATTSIAATEPRLSATVETRYPRPLRARLLDASGQPIEGASVTFTIAPSDSGAGASFLGGSTTASELTDSNGQATSPPFRADKTAGRFTATATTPNGGEPASYRLENLPSAPETVTAGVASGQSTPTGSRFPVPLAVTVTDKNGNPIARLTVIFTAPARGPSGYFTIHRTGKRKPARAHTSRTARVATNSNGFAIAPPFTANTKAGGYIVTAAIKGTSKRAAFALVNQPRP
jgi:protocatechuate 3,4-dioxygenase beta subunit